MSKRAKTTGFVLLANRKNKGPKSPDVRVDAQRRGGSRRWGCGGLETSGPQSYKRAGCSPTPSGCIMWRRLRMDETIGQPSGRGAGMGWGAGLSEQARPAAHARRASRCSRMRAMTLGSVTWPISRSFPPHRGPYRWGGRWVVRGGCRAHGLHTLPRHSGRNRLGRRVETASELSLTML